MPQSIRAEQTTQPTFGDVRVGVVYVGLKDGVPTTRLLVRTNESAREVDLSAGQRLQVPGHGILGVTSVEPAPRGAMRGVVDLTWDEDIR